jgi:hypothetical protein
MTSSNVLYMPVENIIRDVFIPPYLNVCSCMYTCMYACMHALCVCVCVCVCTRARMCMCVCVLICKKGQKTCDDY